MGLAFCVVALSILFLTETSHTGPHPQGKHAQPGGGGDARSMRAWKHRPRAASAPADTATADAQEVADARRRDLAGPRDVATMAGPHCGAVFGGEAGTDADADAVT